MAENNPDSTADVIALAGDITIAWLQNPNVHPASQDVPAFLKAIHAAIAELGGDPVPDVEAVTYEPAVSVRSSVKADHLVSLIDGRKFKSLKRHLSTHGLTPDAYRARYGLKSDYPMVAESYTAERRAIAKKLGLGRKPAASVDPTPDLPVAPVVEAPKAVPAKPKRAGRKPAGEVAVQVAATPDAAADIAAAPSVPPRKEARKARGQVVSAAVSAPDIAAAKPVSAESKSRPKRMARQPAAEASAQVVAPPLAEPAVAPEKASSAKPRVGRKSKAEAVTDAPAVPVKRSRAKKAAPDVTEQPVSEA